MATFDYSLLKNTAEALLTQFGLSTTLRSAQTSVSGEPWVRSAYGTPIAITLVDTQETEDFKNDTGIVMSVRNVFISTDTTASPKAGDQILMDGVWHTLVAVMPLNPGGTNMLWIAKIAA